MKHGSVSLPVAAESMWVCAFVLLYQIFENSCLSMCLCEGVCGGGCGHGLGIGVRDEGFNLSPKQHLTFTPTHTLEHNHARQTERRTHTQPPAEMLPITRMYLRKFALDLHLVECDDMHVCKLTTKVTCICPYSVRAEYLPSISVFEKERELIL